jgi:hypothetical protein
MRRRALLQSVLRLAAAIPVSGLRTWAQIVAFPAGREQTLKDLAAVVLPESLGRAATDTIADQFARWVREYRPSADMTPGYGFPRLRKKPPSPAAAYLAQLDQIASEALTQPDLAAKRRQLAESIQGAKISNLPQIPDGTHVAVDLMSFYFQGSEANDLAHNAAIGRDQCRGLRDSGIEPSHLGGANRAAL